jgi:hypothetical protein
MRKIILALFATIFLMSFVSSTAWPSSLNTNITAYYNFENTLDLVQGNYNLTVFGSNSVGTYKGIIGKALNSTGQSGSYTNISNGTNIIVNSTSGWSANFWINTTVDSTSGAGYKVMYQIGNSTSSVRALALNNKPYFSLLGSGGVCNLDLDCGASCGVINNSNWNMITTVLNSTAMTIYLNGTYRISSSIVGCNFNGSKQAIIGAETQTTRNYNALFDEFSLFNRALTASEISTLYNNGAGIPYLAGVTLNTPVDGSTIPSRNIYFNISEGSITGTTLRNLTVLIFDKNLNPYTSILFNVTGTENETYFNISGFNIGTYYFSAFSVMNDSSIVWSDSNKTFNVGALFSNFTFNATTFSSALESISVDVIIPDSTTILDGSLIYSGSNYSTTRTVVNGTKYKFSSIVSIPSVTVSTAKTFLFFANLTDGASNELFNSTTQTQTVSVSPSIVISPNACASGFSPSLFFNVSDEVNFTSLNATTINYNFQYGVSNTSAIVTAGTLSNTNNFILCINNTAPSYTLSYGEVQYSLTGYSDRRFYVFSGTRLVNQTVNNTLAELNNGQSTSFALQVQSTSLNYYPGVYTALLRWYPNVNAYRVVEMGKTDDTGNTVIHVKTEDVDYRIGVYRTDGTLIYLADPIRMVCLSSPCSYNLRVPEETDSYSNFLRLQYSLDYNYTSGIWTYVFNDPTQTTNEMNLTINILAGNQEYAVCSSIASASTGVLTCDTSLYHGALKAYVIRTASPPVIVTTQTVNTDGTVFQSSFGLFLSYLIAVPLILVFAFISPAGVVIGGIVAFIPAFYFGSINLAIFGGIAVLGGLVLHFIKRI